MRDSVPISAFVMYCVNGESGSSLRIDCRVYRLYGSENVRRCKYHRITYCGICGASAAK